ncbi:MAG: tyrosine-type recombinase/integrase [Pseudomonadota bacterium]
MPNSKLTKTVVENASSKLTDYFIWDTDLKGFGVKIAKGGRKSYVCQYRTPGGRAGESRRLSIGAHGAPWTVDLARAEAKKILGRAANGEDPAADKQELKAQLTVGQLCEQYLAHGCATKKASTIATDKGRIERHIKPLLGRKRVPDVTRADIKRFLQDVAQGKTAIDAKTKSRGRAIVRGGKGTATRTVGLLGGIFSYAVDCGLIEANPVVGIKRFPDKKGDRYLSNNELAALGAAIRLSRSAGENSTALSILELLIFTGARRGEIEALRWSEVDFDSSSLRLGDSKTGQKTIAINAEALRLLKALIPSDRQKHVSSNEFVFPAYRGNGYYRGTPHVWERVRAAAGLQDVRIHDLRHSFASVAVSMGASLPMIGALLGHADSATTQRYAHFHDDPLRAASELIGNRIATVFNSHC